MTMNVSGYAARSATEPLGPYRFERREPRAARRRDRHPLLRRLPFRSAHRPQRMGRHASIRACPATRSSAASPRSAARSRSSRSATSSASAAWSIPASTATPAPKGWSNIARTASPAPTTAATQDPAGHTLRRLFRADRRRRAVRAAHRPCRGAARRGRAAALRRHHHLLAAAPLEGRARAEGRHRRARRARPHGRQARPRAGRARRRLHHLAESKRAGRAAISAPTRSSSRATPSEMDGACEQLRLHPQHRRRAPRPRRLHDAAEARRHDGAWSACPSTRTRRPTSATLIFKRRAIAGSLIGGIAETQEMLDFCAEHGIVSDIEMIPIQEINEAYDRMLKSDVNIASSSTWRR